MLVKRFKNGNFNLKREHGEKFHDGALVHLIWALQDSDCQIFGDEYCLSNYEMAVDMYSYYSDKLIMIPYSVLDDLENGKTIKLYARDLDEWDREEYNRLEELGEL